MVLFEGDEGGSEGAVGVGETEVVVEEAVGPGSGGAAAEGVLGLGKLEEVVEGGVEKVDLVEAGADPGGEVALGLRPGLPGPEGADLVLEPGDGRVGPARKAGGADVVGLLRQRSAFRGGAARFWPREGQRAAETGYHFFFSLQ